LGTFVLIFIFDYLKLSPNASGFLGSINNIDLIIFFDTPEFNALYTLCLVISILIFVFGLFGKSNKES